MGRPVDPDLQRKLRALGERVNADHRVALDQNDLGEAWLERARAGALATVKGPEALHQLGQAVARSNDNALSLSNSLQDVRGRLLRPSRHRDPPWAWLLGGTGALAAAAALAFVVLAPPAARSPLTVAVVAQTTTGGADLDRSVASAQPRGSQVAAGGWLLGVGPAVRFSDGSTARATTAARYRVAALRASGADIELTKGQIAVNVVPRAGNQWRIHAGPFVVHVLGTAFDVSWDPSNRGFALALRRGRVRIEGPVIGSHVLNAGQQISVSTVDQKFVLEALQAPAARVGSAHPQIVAHADKTGLAALPPTRPRGDQTVGRATAAKLPKVDGADHGVDHSADDDRLGAKPIDEAPPNTPSAATAPSRHRQTRRRPTAGRPTHTKAPRMPRAAVTAPTIPTGAATAPTTPTVAGGGEAAPLTPTPSVRATPETAPPPWRLAEQGKWHAAVDAAERMGWSRVAATATAQELLLVADAARLSHATTAATKAYELVRGRHPGTGAAAQAAFSLGRLRFRQGRWSDAARWFERYVAERPQGSLAEQARGRAMACRAKLGDDVAACGAAVAYIAHHPKGPRASLALKTRLRCHAEGR